VPELTPQTLAVLRSGDGLAAQRRAHALAQAIGFDARATEEVVLAVSELASNLVKYAGGGTLTLTRRVDGTRVGVQVESRDHGPGIGDVERALTDGFSTGGGLGYGLGTVNRFMDELDITPLPGAHGGARIVGTRWLRPWRPLGPCPLAFGAATRPLSGMDTNGDAFIIKRWGESALVAVIDGLGHGQFAQRAAHAAREYVEQHFDQPLDAIFRGTGRACRATRGVVMAVARFDCRPDAMTLSFASIGNIAVRVIPGRSRSPVPHSDADFIARRGVLGLNAPKAVATKRGWDARDLLVLHSDGVRSHWHWSEFAHLADQPAAVIAPRLLHALRKENDDATVVVVRDDIA
jgi:anti-sigma regulatory factor (Ser/Thr protein kinase)